MKPIFTKADTTNRLLALFSEMSIGQELSFADASKVVGFEVTSTTPAYQSAKRIAVRDNGVVVASIRSFGFKRLDGTGMVKSGFGTQTKIRKAARRGAAVAQVAVRQNLPINEMKDATEQLSRFSIIETTANQRPAKSNKRETQEPEKAEHFDVREALKKLSQPSIAA